MQNLPILFKPILAVCPLWAGKRLFPCIIANPHSGGFTIKKRAENHTKLLLEAGKIVSSRQVCTQIEEFPIFETTCSGHAAEITNSVISRAIDSRANDEFLIITAGGDGTSLEVQTALIKAAEASPKTKEIISTRISVLRLPFGTGNDGSDGRVFEETLERLIKPSDFVLQKAIKVYYEGSTSTDANKRQQIAEYGSLESLPPWYSFNIASVGIDAFITHNTNKFHDVLPGDFYKLWVDLASVFYDVSFPPASMKVEVYDEKGSIVKEIDENAMFCLLGVSGHRTYGSGQKILPDDRNFCFAKSISVFKKIKMKKLFLTGKHTETGLTILDSASKVCIKYDKCILVQLDGEVHLLQPENFPLVFELTEPIIRTIQLKK